MGRIPWQVRLGAALIGMSAAVYFIHYQVFHDSHHIFIYMLGDLAFMPIEVLLVTLILHDLLAARERNARLEKLNMVIGAFYSEVGTDLMSRLAANDDEIESIRRTLTVRNTWTDREFAGADRDLRAYAYRFNIATCDLADLRSFLASKRNFLLRLLENPNLLEHESFTGLLRAVFHLTEELQARGDLGGLPQSDYEHLAGDIERVYRRLVHEWLDYMKFLQRNYPFLFSLALRTNPFDRAAVPVVT